MDSNFQHALMLRNIANYLKRGKPMSDYCNCCSSNIEWLEEHYYIDFEETMDSDPKELAKEIRECSKEEMGKKAPPLDELTALIQDIQYLHQPATVKKVSIHEAGHAVMEYHYGNIIESIQIGGDIAVAGMVKSIKNPDSMKKLKEADPNKVTDLLMKDIKKHCHIMLAGVAAEHIYDGKKEVLPTSGHKFDIANCKDLLKTVIQYSFQDQDIYDQFFPETVKILDEKWKAVEALAQVLEDKWSEDGAFIEGEDVVRIIKQSLQLSN
jgi:hypothetical protein